MARQGYSLHPRNYEVSKGVEVQGESLFEPDLSLSISEIFARSIHLLEDSPYHRSEMPDDVPDVYDDFTDFFETPEEDEPKD